jgi:hypothetical protein
MSETRLKAKIAALTQDIADKYKAMNLALLAKNTAEAAEQARSQEIPEGGGARCKEQRAFDKAEKLAIEKKEEFESAKRVHASAQDALVAERIAQEPGGKFARARLTKMLKAAQAESNRAAKFLQAAETAHAKLIQSGASQAKMDAGAVRVADAQAIDVAATKRLEECANELNNFGNPAAANGPSNSTGAPENASDTPSNQASSSSAGTPPR